MYSTKSKSLGYFNSIVTSLCFVLLLAYFVYHAVSGDRGFLALMHLSQRVHHMQQQLDTVKAERLYYEHRVNSLREDSLDLDLLDEQARVLLGYTQSGEEVYHVQ